MIIVSILLIALLLLASAIVVRCVFKPRWVWLNKIILIAAILAFAFGNVSIVARAVCENDISTLKAEYEHITLYYNIVNESDNEYVRFDFYQRIKDYNVRYMNLQNNTKSAWIGAFYPKGWDSEIGLIDFMLRTGSEDGVYEDFFDDEVLDDDAVG
jgi:glucan phosphoethanolaminetransferase (alkaline phosphatase superfamily)